MGDITTARWTRYGKDRLYLSRDGARLGWYDLRNGQLHLESEAERRLIEALLSREGHDVAAGSERTASPDPTSPPVAPLTASESRSEPAVPPSGPHAVIDASPGWEDLAGHRPGQGARARAEEERAAQRERSRVGSWLARTLDVKTDERAWRVGADGEETIGSKLDKLTEHGWRVLHSVPVGRGSSDIDHVLVGPGGVFTVNTKKHPNAKIWIGGDTVLVNGHRQPYVRNSRHEAQRATRLLSAAVGFEVTVRGVIVFTTATLFPDVTVKKAPADVVVLDRMDVPRAFKRARRTLGPDEIDAIYEAARRSTTWRT